MSVVSGTVALPSSICERFHVQLSEKTQYGECYIKY